MTRTEESQRRIDEAKDAAFEAIPDEDVDAFRIVVDWWGRWYGKAGHRRLARILLEFTDTR